MDGSASAARTRGWPVERLGKGLGETRKGAQKETRKGARKETRKGERKETRKAASKGRPRQDVAGRVVAGGLSFACVCVCVCARARARVRA